MTMPDRYDVTEPSTFSADVTLNNQQYHVDIRLIKTKSEKNWQFEVDVSGDNIRTTQKTEPVALGLLRNKAVIGFCLNPDYHRPSEHVVDLTAFLDKETVDAIEKLGERTLCTLTQSGHKLTIRPETNITGYVR